MRRLQSSSCLFKHITGTFPPLLICEAEFKLMAFRESSLECLFFIGQTNPYGLALDPQNKITQFADNMLNSQLRILHYYFSTYR